MNYFISRDGQEYGPYSLGDLQRYVASGEILVTDIARSEGMSEPLPVSRIIGTIPVPVVARPVAVPADAPIFPDPPNLHWGLVLLFEIVTCGLFDPVWGLVQSVWMRKVDPQSRALYYYIALACIFALIFFHSMALAMIHTPDTYAALFNLLSGVVSLCGRFSLKHSLEEHFNSAEPMGVQLSGVMTFFFGPLYFQYHFNDIVRRKNIARMSYLSA